MDIAELYAPLQRQEEGAWIDIVQPDGTPTDIRLRVAGPDSERQRLGRFKTITEFQRRIDRQGRMSPENSDAMNVDLLARSVIEWQNIEDGDQPLECSHENVVKVLTALPWFRSQVDLFAASREPYRADQSTKGEAG